MNEEVDQCAHIVVVHALISTVVVDDFFHFIGTNKSVLSARSMMLGSEYGRR